MVYRRRMKDIRRDEFLKEAYERGCTHYYLGRVGVYDYYAPYTENVFIAYSDPEELPPLERADAREYGKKIQKYYFQSSEEITRDWFKDIMLALGYTASAYEADSLTIDEMVATCEKWLEEYYTRGCAKCELRYSGVRRLNLRWWKEKERLENFINKYKGVKR